MTTEQRTHQRSGVTQLAATSTAKVSAWKVWRMSRSAPLMTPWS
ncbi:hypothetical protein [Micromonospora arida]